MNTRELIEFLEKYERGGATGRLREVKFYVRNENGESVEVYFDGEDFSTGDGLITDITLYLKPI